ncbi:MAG: TRAP transporter large permease [Acidobacteriota bacterium]|nr:TRAP transporter large permease [Acidobacteriota bacterium]
MDPLGVVVLVGAFLVLLAVGVPIAFAVGVAGAASLLLSVPAEPALTTVAQRLATGIDSFALLAIPLFILSGQLMNRGGSAERLVALGRALVGPLPGGLIFVNVVGCLLFGAVSGSAVATAAGVGAFMIPLMEREGYSREQAAAVNITASTTGLLVPPSNVLIVYSLASGGVSIAALFLAGYVPGILVGVLIAIAAVWTSGGRSRVARWELAELRSATLAAAPSLLLVGIVMGGIVGGVFTATEAAGVAVVYALVLGLGVYREIRIWELRSILTEAATTTGVVLFLVAASMAMSWVMAYENIPQAVSEAFLGLAAGPLAVLAVMNLLLLAVGTFMDMTPAVLIFTPIFLPVALELGIDPIHFGIVMVLNLCVGLCTPPVGTVLFVGCGAAGTDLRRVLPALLPLYIAMVVALIVVTLVPDLSLALPRAFGFAP